MKALTIYQPWASLIMSGAKRIETRSWRTTHRGPLAIHAGKTLLPHFLGARVLPLGAVLGRVDLIDCIVIPRASSSELSAWLAHQGGSTEEVAFGDYRAGRWAWLLRDPLPFTEPVPARGHQTLWEWPC